LALINFSVKEIVMANATSNIQTATITIQKMLVTSALIASMVAVILSAIVVYYFLKVRCPQGVWRDSDGNCHYTYYDASGGQHTEDLDACPAGCWSIARFLAQSLSVSFLSQHFAWFD
jgi:hypothetical protein